MTRAATLMLLSFCGCAFRVGDSAQLCKSDGDCGQGQLCFANGCGDPGQDLFVEVVPNSGSGAQAQAQDFPILNLQANENVQLFGPAALVCEVLQASAAYAKPVTIQANGESLLIPGRARSYESTPNPNTNPGVFDLSVGTGVYSLVVTATQDVTIPPQVIHGVTINPGDRPLEQISFPTPPTPQNNSTFFVDGTLSYAPGAALYDGFQIQALDPQSLDPLSQVGTVQADGSFQLFLDNKVLGIPRYILQATPLDPTKAPSKAFVVQSGDNPVGLRLDMGAYGQLVPTIGQVVDSNLQAVAGATVFVAGTVADGGVFQSQATTTDTLGNFHLQSLPSSSDGQLSVWAVPPPGHPAGVLQQPTAIPPLGNSPLTLTCPDRISVSGTILTPDGHASVGSRVSATAVSIPDGARLPSGTPQATTDSSGNFTLALDPAVYRIDCVPGDTSLPQASWSIDLTPKANIAAGSTVPAAFTLYKGRIVTGSITAAPSAYDPTQNPIANATVSFFRVRPVQGLLVSFPLAQAVADSNGNYSVVLPTR